MVAVSDRQRQQLEGIRERHRLRLLLAFGSRVKGTSHPASDLDIAVLADARPASPSRFLLDVAAELDAVFPSEKLDLALLNGADPLLLGEVSADCRLLAGDASDLQEFRIYAFKRRQDHRRWLELEARTNARRLAEL